MAFLKNLNILQKYVSKKTYRWYTTKQIHECTSMVCFFNALLTFGPRSVLHNALTSPRIFFCFSGSPVQNALTTSITFSSILSLVVGADSVKASTRVMARTSFNIVDSGYLTPFKSGNLTHFKSVAVYYFTIH